MAEEPVIPLYPGDHPPAGLDMYQGYSMGSADTAKDFLAEIFINGVKGFKGINTELENLDDLAHELVHSFAVGRSTPLVDLFPFTVSLANGGHPTDVKAEGNMPKKVGLLDERLTWDKFTAYHRSLPSHGINVPDRWVDELEAAFEKIYNGSIFDQPMQSAGETGERFLPVIHAKLTRDAVVESIDVRLVRLAEQIQVGGRIFRVLALFEQLQSDVLSRLKKWSRDETPADDEWAHIQQSVEIADSLVRELRDRASDVSRMDRQVISIDDQTLAELLGYAGRGVPAALKDAAESKDADALREGLREFDTETGRIWIATAHAYLVAVESVMGPDSGPTDLPSDPGPTDPPSDTGPTDPPSGID